MQKTISKTTMKFLKELTLNNNREWFLENKVDYLKAQLNMSEFVDALILEMNKHDVLVNTSGKKSLYRIYNDVRFSKDKSPFNARFAFGFQRASKLRRGGYYVNIKPGNCYLACGFFAPNPQDLKRIREDIAVNYKKWNSLLKSKVYVNTFDGLEGAQVATAPRGFSIDHPAIELLRNKQFIFKRKFSDKEAQAEDFLLKISETFKTIRPIFNHLSEVLTTDLNGELIV